MLGREHVKEATDRDVSSCAGSMVNAIQSRQRGLNVGVVVANG